MEKTWAEGALFRMVNAVSASTSVAHSQATTPQPAAQPEHPSAKLAEDTVSISAAGQKAAQSAGDVDHDGDSH